MIRRESSPVGKRFSTSSFMAGATVRFVSSALLSAALVLPRTSASGSGPDARLFAVSGYACSLDQWLPLGPRDLCNMLHAGSGDGLDHPCVSVSTRAARGCPLFASVVINGALHTRETRDAQLRHLLEVAAPLGEISSARSYTVERRACKFTLRATSLARALHCVFTHRVSARAPSASSDL